MTQLTVRGFDPELERALRNLARRKGISLNRAALELMRRGSGLAAGSRTEECVGSSLDHLVGTWGDDEAEQILRVIESCSQIDEDLWL